MQLIAVLTCAGLNPHRLLRVATLWRRAGGKPFRWMEHVALRGGLVSRSLLLLCNVVYASVVLLQLFVCTAWVAIRFSGPSDSASLLPVSRPNTC